MTTIELREESEVIYRFEDLKDYFNGLCDNSLMSDSKDLEDYKTTCDMIGEDTPFMYYPQSGEYYALRQWGNNGN